MRHGKKIRKLGKVKSHRKAMLRNMLTSFFKYRKIRTTESKAKFARPFAEKLITKAMKNTLASKRYIISYLQDREVADILINEIAFIYKDNPTGGYTRVIKLAQRQGDGAKMAFLELVDPESRKPKKKSAPKVSKTEDDYSSVENESVDEVETKEEVETDIKDDNQINENADESSESTTEETEDKTA
jgi:large subunit ribosomal protein L17